MHPNRQGCGVVCGVPRAACTPRTRLVNGGCLQNNTSHIVCKFSTGLARIYPWCWYCLQMDILFRCTKHLDHMLYTGTAPLNCQQRIMRAGGMLFYIVQVYRD